MIFTLVIYYPLELIYNLVNRYFAIRCTWYPRNKVTNKLNEVYKCTGIEGGFNLARQCFQRRYVQADVGGRSQQNMAEKVYNMWEHGTRTNEAIARDNREFR